MCAKLNQAILTMLPKGLLREGFKSFYYGFYYNKKHFKDNDFYVYYNEGYYKYTFDEGVVFASYEDMTDELKRSLRGYLRKYPLKAGDTVIDCGAYIGEFTLYAARRVGASGKVIAFEPDPNIYRKLEANVRLNGLENIILINKGVWSKDGVLKFVGDRIGGYSFMLAEKSVDAVDIPVVSLDNELDRLGVKKVDFIKVDVEGAELELVMGAEKTLKNNNVHSSVASYHLVNGQRSCAELEKLFSWLGYKAETGHPQHLTTYAWK